MRIAMCVTPSDLLLEVCLRWKAVKRALQRGLFPSHLPLSRLGLMAEEMTV